MSSTHIENARHLGPGTRGEPGNTVNREYAAKLIDAAMNKVSHAARRPAATIDRPWHQVN
jgi:hypothetical protein